MNNKNKTKCDEEPPLNRLQNFQASVWQEKECKVVCQAEII